MKSFVGETGLNVSEAVLHFVSKYLTIRNRGKKVWFVTFVCKFKVGFFLILLSCLKNIHSKFLMTGGDGGGELPVFP